MSEQQQSVPFRYFWTGTFIIIIITIIIDGSVAGTVTTPVLCPSPWPTPPAVTLPSCIGTLCTYVHPISMFAFYLILDTQNMSGIEYMSLVQRRVCHFEHELSQSYHLCFCTCVCFYVVIGSTTGYSYVRMRKMERM